MKARLLLLGLISLPAFSQPSPADFHRAVYALHERQLRRARFASRKKRALTKERPPRAIAMWIRVTTMPPVVI